MSGLLFLAGVVVFVLIVQWAYKNDALKADEIGSGLLAMRLAPAAKQKSVPKWKKAGVLDRTQVAAAPEKPVSAKARWRRSFHYGKDR